MDCVECRKNRADQMKELYYENKENCREAYQDGYNQALEDLVRLVCKYYTMQERAGYYSDTNNMIKQRVVDFAEDLKR